MKKIILISILLIGIIVYVSSKVLVAEYKGVENCSTCHSGVFNKWNKTLHSKIHLAPTPATMIGDYTKEVSFGSSYANAKAGFRIDGSGYYIVLKPAVGSEVEYKVVYTYGIGWKQRYLVKIEDSYYMPPVQWNTKGYINYESGNWVAYNPQNWFNADGSLKPLDNAFRKKSWDKNCAGCHVVPGKTEALVTLKVNGNDSSWVYHWANDNSLPNIVIGCESCHGPALSSSGKGHVNNLQDISYSKKVEVCGQCHFRGTSSKGTYEYPYDEEKNKTFIPGYDDLASFIVLKPGLWPDLTEPRQHHQQWQDFKNTKHYNESMGMTCQTCHDPHQTTDYKHQLTDDFDATSGDNGCLKCHSNKAEEKNGINLHSKHPAEVSNCASCHMAKVASSGKGYDISSHTLRVITPEMTIKYKDNAATKGMPNTCAVSCHRNASGNFGSGPDWGIKDVTLGDWSEATDIQLADTLWKYYKLMFQTTDVKEQTFSTTNSALGNFPNPFKSSTNFELNVSKNANYEIRVYSVNGELINIVLNKYLVAGTYTVNWEARSHDGYILPPGRYFAVATLNGKPISTTNLNIVK